MNQTQINKDLKNKKLIITREFNAPIEKVWSAWTQSDLLDQWWAPKPWMAKTKSMNFNEGGNWIYAMVGPDGTTHWNNVAFSNINEYKSFKAVSIFCDENGIQIQDMPAMFWKNEFVATPNGTKLIIESSFEKEAELKKIIEMGFEAGFTMAHGNLDELLTK